MTYRRKPQRDIDVIKNRRPHQGLSPMIPLWLSIGSSLLIFLFVSHFPARFSAPLGFSSKSLLVAVASGVGIFIFLYAMQWFTRRIVAEEVRTRICDRCHQVAPGGDQQCPCGGEYEPMEFYDDLAP